MQQEKQNACGVRREFASRTPRSYIETMSVLLLLLLFVFLFLIFVSMIILVIGPFMLLQPYRRLQDYYRKHTSVLHPSDLGLPVEELTLKTTDGIPLSCWLIPARGHPRGTVVYLHGVSECKIIGLPMAALLHNRGFNVLLYDSRRHGESGGSFCTYGFYEKNDASMVLNYLVSRKDFHVGPIGLFGASMGAAVAIQVAARDERIRAVVAESGFSALRTVFDDYQKKMIKLPWHYLRNIVIRRSEHIAHFKANAVSPLQAVQAVRVPIFIIHGTGDTSIHHRYSEMVFQNANEPKELWLVEGARHDNVPEVGGKEYERRIVEFFEKHLVPQSENQ